MIKSMSGFGSGNSSTDEFKINLEMKSVNSRYMDLNIRSPRIFNFAENQIKAFLKDRIYRGRLDIYITFENINFSSKSIELDEQILRQRLDVLNKLKEFQNIDGEIDIKLISSFDDVFVYKNNEYSTEILLENLLIALDEASKELVVMRSKEGNLIFEDLCSKLLDIENEFKDINKLSQAQVENFKEKLESRLNKILDSIEIDEQRLSLELAIYADRVCIDEEVVRFESHINTFSEYIKEDGKVGKKIEFLVQEMNREINTIASKSQDISISNRCVNIKSILEMIREQVQNIE